jgi:polyhydroxyalkanoate synthesis regulator phasin
MTKSNSKLASIIGEKKPKQNLVEAKSIPKPNTTNQQGLPAYSQDMWLKLLTMLNTLKLQSQYYRTEQKTLQELQELIKVCATQDLYFTCQCIVYSRCLGEGMRTISHAAAVFVAPYISGQEYSKRFYGPWDKKKKRGGLIYRPDDMSEIILGFVALNGEYKTTTVTTKKETSTTVDISGTKLTNAMKKGFKAAIESYDSYSLLKYKSSLIDVINLVHPKPSVSQATVKVEGEDVYTIDAIMRGMNVLAETWEVSQGEAGQIVAKAVKEGKLDETEAKEVLTQAKADNWAELLDNNKLPILACLRNLRNILINNPTQATVDKVCALVSNPKLILEGKIFPYQLDLSNEIMLTEFNDGKARQISQALAKGYELAIPNLKALLPGDNVIYLDQSGSMGTPIFLSGKSIVRGKSQCIDKAALIAATIAKATNADIIVFGSTAKYVSYNPNLDVFTLAKQLSNASMGGTNLSTAWSAAQNSGKKYDRVFILSDNEVNQGSTYNGYTSYLRAVGSPYVYSVDLAAYGTNCIAGDKVRYYYGYGFSMFDDIASSEFNANYHIEKVKQVII